MSQLSELGKQYEHALDRMFELFKAGLDEESKLRVRVNELENTLRKVRSCPGVGSAVIEICDKGLSIPNAALNRTDKA